jgi:hypothetical protein
MAGAELKWSPTGAPTVSQRYDDVWFFNPSVGWAVNSAGHILKTTNGGKAWDLKFSTPILPNGRPVYLRCITWANDRVGWVGTLTTDLRLYQTTRGRRALGPGCRPAGRCAETGLWIVRGRSGRDLWFGNERPE